MDLCQKEDGKELAGTKSELQKSVKLYNYNYKSVMLHKSAKLHKQSKTEAFALGVEVPQIAAEITHSESMFWCP